MKTNKMKFIIGILLLINPFFLFAKDYNISNYGAVNDGKTLNSSAIQKAIDDCTLQGGGRIMVDGGGTYVTGTIYLKDNVTIHIDNGNRPRLCLHQ